MHHAVRLITLISLSTALSAHALDTEERTFFGLKALESSHPNINGDGYSVGVSDTEFDVTHPGLGWTGGDEYNTWFYNRQYIPQLNRVNPRIFMAGHRMQTTTTFEPHHGTSITSFALPITYNNTLMTNWWSFHGTAVAGTAAGGQPGPAGNSIGVAPGARFVFAGDTENFNYILSMVPDGNPSRTVSMNRSFTGSSFLDGEPRQNSGIIGVNAAGNNFNYLSTDRTAVFGTSPHVASIRWMEIVGYDLIASGLTLENETNAYASSYGSMRNQESIFTDYTVRTIYSGGYYDSFASGTSFASPLLAGGAVLIQQAYEAAHPGQWLRVDQMQRIIKRSAKFVDDSNTGLRYPVADFNAAVALAETYAGDPGFEPNFSTSFDPEARVNWALGQKYFLNPQYFRASISYGASELYDYTTAENVGGEMLVYGDKAGGNVNIALRNGWGDLARIDMTEPGKSFTAAFRYDTSAGSTGGNNTEFFIGLKEMVGSVQFMDDNRLHDNVDRGRLAFRVSFTKNNTSARVDLLQCTEDPVTSNPYYYEPIWQRTNYYAMPSWSAPLATAFVTNLHNGTLPLVEAGFTSSRATFKIGGQTIIDAPHTASQVGLTRSTPYMHFHNQGADCLQRLSTFSANTTSGGQPAVTLERMRSRAAEGVTGPAASGVYKVRRTTAAASPLTVYYSVSGTAVNGNDYDLLPGSITIPANVASADIQIKPINDSTIEGAETVLVSLTPNGSYVISSQSDTGSIALVDYSDIDGDGLKTWEEDANRNGNLADDDANANMLPNYLDNLDRVPTNNASPVANAGADKQTSATATVALDGSASYDPDGSIAGYSWSIIPGHNQPVQLQGANTMTPGISWTAPAATNRSVQIRLTVYDNYGATGSDTVTVTQLSSPIYNKNYPQVYFRGSPNGWGTTAMTLVDHNTWEIQVTAGAGSQNYKFDVYGDWSLNFGDNNNDGWADQGGGNISLTQGEGLYIIRFNDQSRSYSATKFVPNQPPVANAGGNKTTYQMDPVTLNGTGSYDPDGSIVSYRWFIIEGQDGPVTITGTNTSSATVQWHAPAISSRVVRVQLMVTDNRGSSASDIVTITQTTNLVLSKTYPLVYFRGTANGWITTPMTLVSNYTWQIDATFGSTTDERFKFDVNGDWTLNFGDNNFDGIADQSGADIRIHLGAGTYRIWFNDQTKRFGFNKLVANQAPVANAGQDQTVGLEGSTVTLNGSGSYDPDGSISEYSWYQVSGPIAIITYASPGNPNATAAILGRTNEATYTFGLRVTDNAGAMSTSTVKVIQKAAGFNKTYPQVNFRGSPNGWGSTLMTLISNYVWEIEAAFGSGSSEQFKFDIYGDWSLNFGNNNNDGIADQGGGNIGVTQGAGTYRIRFNDQTKAFTVAKIGGSFIKDYNTVGIAGSFNGWSPSAANMTLIGDNTWSGTFTLSGNVEFKITANGSWGTNWGDNDQPGTSVPLNAYLNGNGGNIRLNNLAGASYRITMNERTLAYSVSLVSGSEAGASRMLVGWEALYGIDLLSDGNGSADPDDDTLTNFDEYNLGTNPFSNDTDRDGIHDQSEVVSATDPLDAGSFLGATPVMTEAGIRVTWHGKLNRLYRVEGNADIDNASGWKRVSEWLVGVDGEEMSIPIVDGFRFYRVLVGEPGVVNTTD